MKIGMIFEDSGIYRLDLRNPENGNPGVGGTQFCFLMLARYLKLIYNNLEVTMYHYNDNTLPEGIISKVIKNDMEAISLASNDKIDILIFRNGKNKEWYNEIDLKKIKSIVWAHNYISCEETRIITNTNYIKRVIFVGKQEYDRYIDHNIIYKSQYIYNMFNSQIKNYKRNNNLNEQVTYTGSLVESKGFHILASQWKKIIKKIPDAKLNVIGSGQLYNRDSKLGKYNIADENYEMKFMRYLIDKRGKIIPSVNFYGVLGQEKINIYNKTMVGVINPSGITETFGLSAVEMEACGIPIVTKNIYGLTDTTKHKKTGLLFNTKRQFKRNIICLLKNKELNIKLGNQAKSFILNEFNPEKIVEQWQKTFEDILKNRNPIYTTPNDCLFNDYKWLRIINRNIKKIKIFRNNPAIIEIKSNIKNMMKH